MQNLLYVGESRQFTSQLKAKVAIRAIRWQRLIGELAGMYQVHPLRIASLKKHQGDVDLSLGQRPVVVQATIKLETDSGKASNIEEHFFHDGDAFYKATVKIGEHSNKLQVLPDGTLLKMKLREKEHGEHDDGDHDYADKDHGDHGDKDGPQTGEVLSTLNSAVCGPFGLHNIGFSCIVVRYTLEHWRIL